MEIIGVKAPKIEKKEFLGRFKKKFPRYGTIRQFENDTIYISLAKYRILYSVSITNQ